MKFYIATELDYYGPEATEQDVEDYIKFAQDYLGPDTEIEEVVTYEQAGSAKDEQWHLREKVWDAFCSR